jgi:tetratricopeptide (TPR) repeat protein/predicted Ser/Thr protein kinase
MGVVYLATDPLLRRTVAIKVLPGGDDEVRERFGREARSAASLRHNNVVTIYDVGEHDDQPFIAMEFLDGESMHEVISRKANVPLEKRLSWMVELCAGLSHAHRSGVIHRDIKPGNLMITTEGSLKILDFGLARLTSGASQAGLTRVGAIMGTPHYMSPEQVNGESVDHRSDIFSVGLVLYELLSYTKAYSGDSAPVVLHNILHKTPPPIRSLLPQIDDELEALVGRAIEKELDQRYPDLATFGADISRVRSRLLRSQDDATQRQSVAAPARGNLDPTFVRPYRNQDKLVERRAAQIAAFIQAATRQYDAGNFDAAISECENALLLNPQEAPALELIDRAHQAMEEARLRSWLDEARALITGGALTAAEALIDQSLKLRADSSDAQALQRELREKRREIERHAEKQRAAQSAIARARGHLSDGAFEAAVRCASEALGYDASNAEAQALKEQAAEAIARRSREQAQRRAASAAIEESKTMVAKGDAKAALTMLKSFQPQELVAGALLDLEKQISQQAAGAQAARTQPVVTPPIEPRTMDATMEVAPPVKEPPRPRKETTQPIAPVGRGLPVTALAAIAGLVIVVGGIGWYFLKSEEAQPQQQEVSAPAPAEPGVASVLSAAQDQFRNRDERGALATLAKIPPGNREAEQLAETIRSGAAARTSTARQAADAARKNGVEPYLRGVEKQNEAAALGTAANVADRAVALLDEATTLFGAALKFETAAVARPDAPPSAGGGAPALTAEQRREVSRLLEEGQRQLSEGEYEAAIAAYSAALRIDATNARAVSGITGTRRAQAAEAAALAGLKKKPGV